MDDLHNSALHERQGKPLRFYHFRADLQSGREA